MKILILGGTGYIGSNIQKTRPHWQWHSIGSKDVDFLHETGIKHFNEEYDVVINAAGFYGGMIFNTRYQQEILWKNTIIATNIFRTVQHLKPKKFIQIGSGCIYPSSAQNLIVEQMLGNKNYHPSLKYSSMAKQWQLDVIPELGIPWEYLILTNIYGPGEPLDLEKSHFVGSLINKLLLDTNHVTMMGTGRAVRDLLFIDDAAEAVCRFCELSTATCQPTNISSGQGISIREITDALIQEVNPACSVVWGDHKDDGILYKVLDNKRMLDIINYTPKTTLSSGLSKTWNSFYNG